MPDAPNREHGRCGRIADADPSMPDNQFPGKAVHFDGQKVSPCAQLSISCEPGESGRRRCPRRYREFIEASLA